MQIRLTFGFVVVATIMLLTACSRDAQTAVATSTRDSLVTDSVARAQQDAMNRAQPGYVVDSLFPVEEELRRFRAALGGDSATVLTGGESTREALVRRFLAAVSAKDTAELRRMSVGPREFADLYYSQSPYARPPYRQSPQLAWRLIQLPSADGMKRMLRRLSGTSIVYVNHVCERRKVHEGQSVRHTGCLVRLVNGRDTTTMRLFGSILERDGQFKFLSYTNGF